jgi:hypothetical protein
VGEGNKVRDERDVCEPLSWLAMYTELGFMTIWAFLEFFVRASITAA